VPCSPLLQRTTGPLEVLAVVRDHPILLCSEPPQTFYPLKKLGFAEYRGGRWRITEAGREATPAPEPKGLPEFFEL
jgi:hypothetical protein